MPDGCSKAKPIFKPLFYLGLILIISSFICVFSSNKESRTPFCFKNGSETTYLQTAFLGPTERSKPELPDFVLVQNTSLQAIVPPYLITPKVLGALIDGSESEIPKREIFEYIVNPGDTLSAIAQNFDISLETILWANNLTQNSKIQPGEKLIILPVSGVLHYVKPGDTISELAQKYKAKIEDIISFNELLDENDIYVGDILVIPDGTMPAPAEKKAVTLAPLAKSYFICPISPPCTISQGLHWYNAIDFTHGKCGDSIYAVAGGKVLKVKYGWNGGAGNYLTILHPNGVVTLYGHILTSFVQPGDEVSQGQLIALMGGQPGTSGAGISTGCHLHFGVTGAKNPFAP